MKTSHLALTLLMSVILGGCSVLQKLQVGPDYERPPIEMPERFRGQASNDPASLADLPWWDVFDDPVLHGLVQEALENNYDLKTAIARVEQFRAQVGVAASDLYPHAGYSGSAAREKAFLPIEGGGNRTFNAFSGVLEVAWELDVWGRIRRSTEAANAQFLASEDTRRAVMLSLVSDVASGYFRLLELDRLRVIARSSADTYERTLELFTQRFEGGKDTQLSTSRAAASLAEGRQVRELAAAVDLSLLRYSTGLANYFEVLEAERQLYPAEDQLAQSQRDQLLTVVTLYKALGGGWKLSDDAWIEVRS
jgi:outer membrane protein TolC